MNRSPFARSRAASFRVIRTQSPAANSEDVLRRALKRAGMVTSYTHVCRRKGCRYSEERAAAEIRPCPRCGYKLWPKGNVRHIRFHDLRHTYASVLLMFGANLTSVQKLLGHSDPEITERRYGHLLPDFMKSEVDRLRFGLDRLAPTLPGRGLAGTGSDSPDFAAGSQRLGTPVVRTRADKQEEAGTPPAIALEIPASLLAGCTGLEQIASATDQHRRRLSATVCNCLRRPSCPEECRLRGLHFRAFPPDRAARK